MLTAATDAGEVLRSADNGINWNAIGALSQVGTRAITVVSDSHYLAITREGAIATGSDGGVWL